MDMSDKDWRDRIYERSERIVGRRVANEFILVPIAGRRADLDSILNLNPIGAFIWDHLDGHTTGWGIIEAIVDNFEVAPGVAEEDCRQFLEQLLSVRAVQTKPF